MDYRRALAPLLILACGAGETVPLREARWITPEARLEQLSTVVVPCISDFSDDPIPGAVAFEDPLLLGGQAARAGISCASCHRGGRGNPAFIFPGVSGAPGTADITASLLSSHRGDGVLNPVPIPDLTNAPPKVSRTVPGALEAFLRGLIVEEFDGADPPPSLLASLAAFVRTLDVGSCQPDRPRTLIYDLARYTMALDQAVAALDAEDRDLALAMLRAARSRLGLIAERYAGAELSAARVRLEQTSGRIETLQGRLRKGEPLQDVRIEVRTLSGGVVAWSSALQQDEERSFYQIDRLKYALRVEQ